MEGGDAVELWKIQVETLQKQLDQLHSTSIQPKELEFIRMKMQKDLQDHLHLKWKAQEQVSNELKLWNKELERQRQNSQKLRKDFEVLSSELTFEVATLNLYL